MFNQFLLFKAALVDFFGYLGAANIDIRAATIYFIID